MLRKSDRAISLDGTRASNLFCRGQLHSVGMAGALGVGSETACNRCSSFRKYYNFDPLVSLKHRLLSSQSTSEHDKDSELEISLAELRKPACSGTIKWRTVEGGGEELISVAKISDDRSDVVKTCQDDLELSDIDADPSNSQQLREADAALSKAILSAPGQSIQQILDNCVEERKNAGKGGRLIGHSEST